MSTAKKDKVATKQSKAAEKLKRKEEKKKKQELKTEKSQKKKEAKELEGEEDIQTTISKIEKSKKSTAVPPSISVCTQPCPRSAFSIVQSPTSDEVIMFGGQYYDGESQTVYGETYRWNISKNEWRMVEVSPSPNPRSCHQAVVHKHHMYIFGGEYSTVRQFYHYRDLWRFDMKANTWEEVKGSGTPPTQRSGHRMIVWKGFILIFGGFHDTFRDCKYYNDLHCFNIAEERWVKIDMSEITMPSPRSGCGFFLHPTNDLAFIYGGYVRDKKASGTDLNDMWQLSLRLQPGTANPVKATWERLSRRGTPPTRRSGASFAVHKNRALIFGGVFDKDSEGLTLDSEFFNELYAFDMDRKRWYILDYHAPKALGGKSRRSKKPKSAGQVGPDNGEESGESENEADNINPLSQFQWVFEYVDEHGKAVQMVVEDEQVPVDGGEGIKEDDIVSERVPEVSVVATPTTPVAAPQVVFSNTLESALVSTPVVASGATFELPPERMGASMFVSGNSLVVFGGISELKDKEVTYDDCWTLDLNARDRWVKKLEGTMHLQEWFGDDEEEDSCDEEFRSEDDYTDSSDDSDSDEEDEEDVVVEEVVAAPVKKSLKGKMEKIRSQYDLTETFTPLVGEPLKDFFARTQEYWGKIVVEKAMTENVDLADYERVDVNDKKDVRKRAFKIATDRFTETAPILAKLAEYESQQAAQETAAVTRRKGPKK